MGSAVTVECARRLEAEILISGGMLNFMTTCYFPCACDQCNKVVQVNLLDAPLRCPHCGTTDPVPFDDIETRLPTIDRRGGFHPSGARPYHRVLVPSKPTKPFFRPGPVWEKTGSRAGLRLSAGSAGLNSLDSVTFG